MNKLFSIFASLFLLMGTASAAVINVNWITDSMSNPPNEMDLSSPKQDGDIHQTSEFNAVIKTLYQINNDNGNIGIGNIEPSERLDVAGNLRVRGLTGDGSRPLCANDTGVLEICTGINIPGCEANEILKWDGDSWECAKDETGGGGDLPTCNVGGILYWNGDTSSWQCGTIEDAIACENENEILIWQNDSWNCTVVPPLPDPTTCSAGQVIKWLDLTDDQTDNPQWECSDDNDTLSSLTSCGNGQIIKWLNLDGDDSYEWTCADPGGDELKCDNIDEMLVWDGSAWDCLLIKDTPTTCAVDEILVSNGDTWDCELLPKFPDPLTCSDGQVMKWLDSDEDGTFEWECADDSLGEYPINLSECSVNGKVIKWSEDNQEWYCGNDETGGGITLPGCEANEIIFWNSNLNPAGWDCGSLNDATTSCTEANQILKWTGTDWDCVKIPNPLTCSEGQVMKWLDDDYDGELNWACGDDSVGPYPVNLDLCTEDGKVIKWDNANERWYCGDDENQIITCEYENQRLFWNEAESKWDCDFFINRSVGCDGNRDILIWNEEMGQFVCTPFPSTTNPYLCEDGDILVWNKDETDTDTWGYWECVAPPEDSDTLAEITSCGNGQVIKWDTSTNPASWVCANDLQGNGITLPECSEDEIIVWDQTLPPDRDGDGVNDGNWDCSTLSDTVSCDNENEILKWDGDDWDCVYLPDFPNPNVDTCSDGQVMKWLDSDNNGTFEWECANDNDTLGSLLSCGEGNIIRWLDSDGNGSFSWECSPYNPGQTLSCTNPDEMLVWDGSDWDCLLIKDTPTTCESGEILVSNGDTWDCELLPKFPDPLTCSDGQVMKWLDSDNNGTFEWECADILDSTIADNLSCSNGQVIKWDTSTNPASWVCANDLQGNGITLPECSEDEIIVWDQTLPPDRDGDGVNDGNWDCSTLSDTVSCDNENEILKWDGDDWDCVYLPDFPNPNVDTCSDGQVMKWLDSDNNGTFEWECANDNDTLGSLLSCGEGNIIRWLDSDGNGSFSWECSPYNPGQTLSCTNPDEMLVWDGSDWDCLLIKDTPTTCESGEILVSNGDTWDCELLPKFPDPLTCSDGQVMKWLDSDNNGTFEWECADILDSTIADNLSCSNGQVIKWDTSTNPASWVCANDLQGNGITLPECSEDEIIVWDQTLPPDRDGDGVNDGNWDCSTLSDTVSCDNENEILKWDGSDWDCVYLPDFPNPNVDTCSEGQVMKWIDSDEDGTFEWECADDNDTLFTLSLVCETGEVLIRDESTESGWGCQMMDTDNDWTVVDPTDITNSDMYSTPGGRVGIGTETPTSKLTVTGDAYITQHLAVGVGSVARGDKTIAAGGGTAWNDYSGAIGNNAEAYGNSAVALGDRTKVYGEGSFGAGQLVEVGTSSGIEPIGAIAMGMSAKSMSEAGISLGYRTTVESNTQGGIALGHNATAKNTGFGGPSFAFGWQNEANNTGAMALGTSTIASGQFALATGNLSTASGDNSFTSGYQTQALSPASIAMGNESIAGTDSNIGGGAVAIGDNAQATHTSAMAFGLLTKATGPGSNAIGKGAVAEGADSLALKNSTAIGDHSLAMGHSSTTEGPYSVAIGFESSTGPEGGFAFGAQARSEGTNSTAIGHMTNASGASAMALGHIARNDKDTSILLATGDRKDLFVSSEGDVGVNTDDPQNDLHVEGGARITDMPVADGDQVCRNDDGDLILCDNTGGGDTDWIEITDINDPQHGVYRETGNVAIGDLPDPNADFVVGNPTREGDIIATGYAPEVAIVHQGYEDDGVTLDPNGSATVQFSNRDRTVNPVDGDNWEIGLDGSDGSFKVNNSYTFEWNNAVTITPFEWEGNANNPTVYHDNLAYVGIGTEDPTHKIDVAGHARIREMEIQAGPIVVAVPAAGDTGGVLHKLPGPADGGAGYVCIDADGNAYPSATPCRDLEETGDNDWVLTDSDNPETSNMYAFPGGNVGIGVENPLQKLHVQGDVRLDELLEFSGGDSYIMTSGTDDPNMFIYTPGDIDVTSDEGYYTYGTSTKDILRISNETGFVGIGVDEPLKTLHVEGTARITDMPVADGDQVCRNDDGDLILCENAEDNDWVLTDPDNPETSNMYAFPEGNVGIGVENPLQKLHVQGDVRLDELLEFSGGDSYIMTSGTDDPNMFIYTPGDIDVTSDEGYYTYGTSTKDILRISNETGFVGIGVDEPLKTLHVEGTARITDMPIADGDQVCRNDDGDLILCENTGEDNDWALTDPDNPDTSNMYSIPGGNVGIGTQAPMGTLHVDGGEIANGNGTDIILNAQDAGLGGDTDGGDILLLTGRPHDDGEFGKVGIGTTNTLADFNDLSALLQVRSYPPVDNGIEKVVLFENAAKDPLVSLRTNGKLGIGREPDFTSITDARVQVAQAEGEPIAEFGTNASATGNSSIAGMSGVASGDYSLAIGYQAEAGEDYSLAIGHNAQANALNAGTISLDKGLTNTDTRSLLMGIQTEVFGTVSTMDNKSYAHFYGTTGDIKLAGERTGQTASDDDSSIFAYFDAESEDDGEGKLGINTETPEYGTLDVNGKVRVRDLTPTPVSIVGADENNVLGEIMCGDGQVLKWRPKSIDTLDTDNINTEDIIDLTGIDNETGLETNGIGNLAMEPYCADDDLGKLCCAKTTITTNIITEEPQEPLTIPISPSLICPPGNEANCFIPAFTVEIPQPDKVVVTPEDKEVLSSCTIVAQDEACPGDMEAYEPPTGNQ
jgi:hypothetical protein